MIKKIVLTLVVIVSLYGSYTAFENGYVGIDTETFSLKYDIPSYEEVQKSKSDFDASVQKLDNLNKTGIPNASGEVDSELRNYAEKKGAYEQLKASANIEQIAEANKIEIYLLDYLWIKVGNYASDNAVKFKMTPDSSNSTLGFDITGSYISVINFIYDLQNDEELNFQMNGIIIRGASSSEVKAKFTVPNINVVTSPDQSIDTSNGVNSLLQELNSLTPNNDNANDDSVLMPENLQNVSDDDALNSQEIIEE